tara:strand:- start:24196 stop:24513 length:318 start_codon:yes stop_codon:yes gene_type:complete
MKLTGKCKEDFEKWLFRWLEINIAEVGETPDQSDIDHFYTFPNSMQWGVIQDFADSVDIDIDEIFESELNFSLVSNEGAGGLSYHRPEARAAAIEKFNELYNQIK